MQIFKMLLLSVFMIVGTTLPVLADNPHVCSVATGCAPPLVVSFSPLGGSGSTFNFGGPGQTLATNIGFYAINSDSQLNGNPITKLNVSCLAYNSYQTTLNTVYNVEDNGMNGGTITFLELNKDGSITTLGNVVLPSAPHGGPYINSATTVLNSTMFPNAGSTLTAYLSSFGSSADQYWKNCSASVSQ